MRRPGSMSAIEIFMAEAPKPELFSAASGIHRRRSGASQQEASAQFLFFTAEIGVWNDGGRQLRMRTL